MKKSLLLLSILAMALSACSPPPFNKAVPTDMVVAEVALRPMMTSTVTNSAEPTIVFTELPTVIPSPTKYIPPTQRPDCNSAKLLGQGLKRHTSESQDDSKEYTVILRLMNTGSCTWTNSYSLILAKNQGMEIEAAQNFDVSALPGESIDLSVNLKIPNEPNNYLAIWLLEDDHGDIFGHGPNRDKLITMDVLVTRYASVIKINNRMFPAEGCFGQPTTSNLPRFGRLMHDPQWMPWDSRMLDPEWPSNFHFDWYPETVQLWTKPRGGDGRFPYSKEWLQYLRALQADDEAAVWIARVSAGLFNSGNDFIPILNLDQLEKEPIAESISSGGNVVLVLEINNNSGRLQMLYFDYSPPSLSEINYFTTPWLITKFTSVSIDGELGNAGGINIFFPNIAKDLNGYWVDMQRVELFPHIPYCVNLYNEVNVYKNPNRNSELRGVLSPRERLLVREYLPQGDLVWGRIHEGWIVLEYQVDGLPVYPTSWRVETRPPILFR